MLKKFWEYLENVPPNLFQWFTENILKGNATKCRLLISFGENVHVNIGTSQIRNSDHVNQICSKAKVKIKVLARIYLSE